MGARLGALPPAGLVARLHRRRAGPARPGGKRALDGRPRAAARIDAKAARHRPHRHPPRQPGERARLARPEAEARHGHPARGRGRGTPRPPRGCRARSGACTPRECARCRRRPSPGCTTSATLLPAFEMFDLRYHLASLAAVFIALAVGILLGVAISGKLSAADNRFAHDRIDQLSEQLQQANATGGHHREAKQGGRGPARDQLPGAHGGTTRRQEHRRALRRARGRERPLVDRAHARRRRRRQSGAAHRGRHSSGCGGARFRAEGRPDARRSTPRAATTSGISASALGQRARRRRRDSDVELALEHARGGAFRRNDACRSTASSSSAPGRPRRMPTSEQEAQARPTETLVDGLISGLQQSGVPVVGVETTTADSSAIELYRTQGVSSVDDVETLPGHVALALLLAGGATGNYGVKDSATDGVAPPIESVPVPSG